MEDRDMPVTKAHLEAGEVRLNDSLDVLLADIRHFRRDVKKTIRDLETTLLNAFCSFAESNNKRLTQLEDNQAAIRRRLGPLEDRVIQVENRLPTQ